MEPFLLIGAILMVVLLVRLAAGSIDAGRIARHVSERGGRVLERTWAPFGPGWLGEKNARIYRVVYEDRDGVRRRAHVKTSMLSGVYMTDEPGEVRAPRADVVRPREASVAGPGQTERNPEELAAELRELELWLLQGDARRSAGELEGVLAEDFRELGTSGQSFDRAGLLASLKGDAATGAEAADVRHVVEDFDARPLGADRALATYLLRVYDSRGAELRASRQSSIWHLVSGDWLLEFQQGTPTEVERGQAPTPFD